VNEHQHAGRRNEDAGVHLGPYEVVDQVAENEGDRCG
jgi:hypothetical protein